jgi:hypothetical protein
MNLAQLKTIEAELKHEIYGLNKVGRVYIYKGLLFIDRSSKDGSRDTRDGRRQHPDTIKEKT